MKTYKLNAGAITRFLVSKGFHAYGPESMGGINGGFTVKDPYDGSDSLFVNHHCPWRAEPRDPVMRRERCQSMKVVLNERFDAKYYDTLDGGFVVVKLKADTQ